MVCDRQPSQLLAALHCHRFWLPHREHYGHLKRALLKQSRPERQQPALARILDQRHRLRIGGGEIGRQCLLQIRQGGPQVLGLPGEHRQQGVFPAALGVLQQAVMESPELARLPVARGIVGVASIGVVGCLKALLAEKARQG